MIIQTHSQTALHVQPLGKATDTLPTLPVSVCVHTEAPSPWERAGRVGVCSELHVHWSTARQNGSSGRAGTQRRSAERESNGPSANSSSTRYRSLSALSLRTTDSTAARHPLFDGHGGECRDENLIMGCSPPSLITTTRAGTPGRHSAGPLSHTGPRLPSAGKVSSTARDRPVDTDEGGIRQPPTPHPFLFPVGKSPNQNNKNTITQSIKCTLVLGSAAMSQSSGDFQMFNSTGAPLIRPN